MQIIRISHKNLEEFQLNRKLYTEKFGESNGNQCKNFIDSKINNFCQVFQSPKCLLNVRLELFSQFKFRGSICYGPCTHFAVSAEPRYFVRGSLRMLKPSARQDFIDNHFPKSLTQLTFHTALIFSNSMLLTLVLPQPPLFLCLYL